MAGTDHWSAYYNADANNTDASSLCAEEPVVITTPGEGCTPGFWQGGVGASLWNSFHDSDWVSAGGDGFNPFLTTDKFIPILRGDQQLDRQQHDDVGRSSGQVGLTTGHERQPAT